MEVEFEETLKILKEKKNKSKKWNKSNNIEEKNKLILNLT